MGVKRPEMSAAPDEASAPQVDGGSWLNRAVGAGIRRRQALRTAATAAAAVAGGALLAACGKSGTAAGNGTSAAVNGAMPVPSSGVVHLYFQANVQFISWNKTTQAVFQEFVDQHFNTNPKYKGIWASCFPSGWGNAAGQITASLAGSGYADVLHMCCSDIPTLEQHQLVSPLDDLLRRDNISVKNWSTGHIAADSYAGKLYGLPSYDGTTCIFYRQDLLDQLGLPYPDPSWDWKSAAQLFTSCAGIDPKTNRKRQGLSVYLDSGTINYWLKGWGADEMNAGQDQAVMSTPKGADCMNYILQLMQTGGLYVGGQDTSILPSAKAVFAMYHSAHVVDVGAQLLGNKYKWNLLPVPNWPNGRSTFDTIDCYLLNAVSKHPDEAWELMKWVNLGTDQGDGTFDNAWPKFQIQINLVTPALVTLWDYWLTTVQQVAPPLQGKDLKWFADAAQKGYGYCTQYFRYQPLTADSLVSSWLNQILTKKVSPELGLQQMQDQVNALQTAGKQEEQALGSTAKLFPTDGPAVAGVPTGI